MYRAVMIVAMMLAGPTWAQEPTIPIGQQQPRERLEFPVLVDGVPIADTEVVGIDFKIGRAHV